MQSCQGYQQQFCVWPAVPPSFPLLPYANHHGDRQQTNMATDKHGYPFGNILPQKIHCTWKTESSCPGHLTILFSTHHLLLFIHLYCHPLFFSFSFSPWKKCIREKARIAARCLLIASTESPLSWNIQNVLWLVVVGAIWQNIIIVYIVLSELQNLFCWLLFVCLFQ